MIHFSYYKMSSRLQASSFDQLLQLLPPFLQNKILKFRNWQDAERCLAGNILLMRGLQMLGRTEYALHALQYTKFQKPYFDEAISFNISHSGEYIICAISETNKVGVDIEVIKDIAINDFNNLFANQEWDEVIKSENKLHAFFTLWTKKEAFLKAVGSGLSQPLNEVIIESNSISWEGETWFLNEIKLDLQHIVYLCSDVVLPLVQVKEIYL